MWCRNASKQLSALVDGELAPAQELAVQSHVESCPRCAGELTRMRSLVQLTRGIPMEAVPAGLYNRTLTQLAYAHVPPAAATPARRKTTAPAVWLWPAFAGAAAAIVIAGLGQPPRPVGVAESRRPEAPIPAVAAPAPVAPHVQDEAHAIQPERSAPRVAAQPSQPTTEVPQPVKAPSATSLSGVPAVTRVASVTRSNRPASRGAAADARAAVSRGPVSTGASPDPGEERVQPEQPERESAPAPMIAEVPDATASGNEPKPENTEMASAPDRDASMRMAGFTSDADTGSGEDEGAQMLRTYLAERNRTVPQPPAVGMGRRRHSKPL